MQGIPRILLLGDSIRMSYQPHVANLLDGISLVLGPEDNCQHSRHTLSSLDRWIGELGTPDIVHWNNGIHDSGYNPERSPTQMPIREYRRNLQLILDRLTAITPYLIWATTTPVHPDRPFRETEWSWRNGEIDQFNGTAKELMTRRGIAINDLHAVVKGDIASFLSEDQLHLSEAGQRACAKAVMRSVSQFLPLMGESSAD